MPKGTATESVLHFVLFSLLVTNTDVKRKITFSFRTENWLTGDSH